MHLEELKEECIPLKRAYADVAQESPKTENKGYVKVSFLEPDEEQNYTEKTLSAMGEEVQRLLSEGVKLNDITILVRKNKNIPPIADFFDKELHLPVVSDEAFRLDASLAICMLIDALRYLSNPEEKIARASLITNYSLQITGKGEAEAPLAAPADWHKLLTADARTALPAEFVARMDELRLMPLYELLEELFTLFDICLLYTSDAADD